MADYSWFRLLVRALGLVFVGLSVPGLVSGVTEIISHIITLQQSGRGGTPNDANMFFYMGGHWLGALLQCGFGAYLFLGGAWVIERALRGVYGHCAACGYDVRQHAGPLCPECGVLLPGRGGAAKPDAAPAGRS